jgi:orotidine-5'-phosphate decarboxylase
MKKLCLIIGLEKTEMAEYTESIATRHCEQMTHCDLKKLDINNCIENIKEAPTQAILISGFPKNTIEMKEFDKRLEKETNIELVMVMELLENNNTNQKSNENDTLNQIREFYKHKKVYKALDAEATSDNVCAMMELAIYSRVNKEEY